MHKEAMRTVDDLRAAAEELSGELDDERFLRWAVEMGGAARKLLAVLEAASTKTKAEAPQYDEFGERVVALLRAYGGRWVSWDVLDAKFSADRDLFGADYEARFNEWHDLWREINDPRIVYEELPDDTERWRYIDNSTEVSSNEQSVKSEKSQSASEAVVAKVADAHVGQPKPRGSAQKPAIQKPAPRPEKPKDPEKPKPTRLGPVPKKQRPTVHTHSLYATERSPKKPRETAVAVKPSVVRPERVTEATAPETTLTDWGLWKKDYGDDGVDFYVSDKRLKLDLVAKQILELLLCADEPIDLRYLHGSVKLEPSDCQGPTIQRAVSNGVQNIERELRRVGRERMLERNTEIGNGGKRIKYQLTGILRQTADSTKEDSPDFLER